MFPSENGKPGRAEARAAGARGAEGSWNKACKVVSFVCRRAERSTRTFVAGSRRTGRPFRPMHRAPVQFALALRWTSAPKRGGGPSPHLPSMGYGTEIRRREATRRALEIRKPGVENPCEARLFAHSACRGVLFKGRLDEGVGDATQPI